MTERTTDPDAGRLPTIAERDDADLLELYAQLRARLCLHRCADNVHAAHDEARDELTRRFAALRERAERAARERDRIEALALDALCPLCAVAREGRWTAAEPTPDRSGHWRHPDPEKMDDGHWCQASVFRRALDDSPAPEVRDADR